MALSVLISPPDAARLPKHLVSCRMMFAGAVQTELHSTSSHLWRSAVTKEEKSIPDLTLC